MDASRANPLRGMSRAFKASYVDAPLQAPVPWRSLAFRTPYVRVRC